MRSNVRFMNAASTVTTFGAAAPLMFENGYSPIPLAPNTKQPMLSGWSHLNADGWNVDDLGYEIQHYNEAACGWAVGTHNLALDLDITDQNIAERASDLAKDILGDTPLIRIGLEPKQLLIYRTNGDIRSTKPHPIEVFSGTGQCAVFGHHEKAGRPYQWPQANILEIASDSEDIPLVTTGKLTEFMSRMHAPLQELRRVDDSVPSQAGPDIPDARRALKSLLTRLPWRQAAIRLLEQTEEGGRHVAIYVLITSAHRHGVDETELLGLLERRAPTILDEVGARYVNRVLDQTYGAPIIDNPE